MNNQHRYDESMKSLPYTTFQELHKAERNRRLVLFGAGNICQKTLRRLNAKPTKIFDNSPNLWGEVQEDINIEKPCAASFVEENYYVVICTTSFREVSEQLVSFGLEPERDFAVSPVLNDLRVIDEIQHIEKTLIVTSGAPSANIGLSEGGVYRIDISGLSWEINKILPGSAHGIIQKDDNIFIVEDARGIIQFDRRLNLVQTTPIPPGSRGHGLAWSEKRRCFYVACSGLDQVLEYSESFELKRRINISLKSQNGSGPHHHINDCYVYDDSLYVSMFSITGNWKQEIFDGGVIEIDLNSNKQIGVPITNLWMPHNITMARGGFIILDSLRGRLMGNNIQEIGRFPAFTRGFTYDADYMYIGQSRNRNFSRQIGVSNNISIDSGIIVFDEETKVSRTIHLPTEITEIHGLLVY